MIPDSTPTKTITKTITTCQHDHGWMVEPSYYAGSAKCPQCGTVDDLWRLIDATGRRLQDLIERLGEPRRQVPEPIPSLDPDRQKVLNDIAEHMQGAINQYYSGCEPSTFTPYLFAPVVTLATLEKWIAALRGGRP